MNDEPMPGVGDEAAHHAGFLATYREDVIDGVLSLTADEQRRTILPSGWTPIELLSHVAHMEQRWFLWRFLGQDVADPFGDWHDGDHETHWEVPPDVTADDLASRLRGIGREVTDLLATHALTERVAEFRGADHPDLDLRWICFHVLAEYARHAGHLDIVVELTRAGPPTSATG